MNYIKAGCQATVNFIEQNSPCLVSYSFHELQNLCLQDRRIAKVVSGFFLSLMGIALLVKKGWNPLPIRIIEDAGGRHQRKTCINYKVLLASLMLTGYGFYQFFSGLNEFYSFAKGQKSKMEKWEEFENSLSEMEMEWHTKPKTCQPAPLALEYGPLSRQVPEQFNDVDDLIYRCDLTRVMKYRLDQPDSPLLLRETTEKISFNECLSKVISLKRTSINEMVHDYVFQLTRLRNEFLPILQSVPCDLNETMYAKALEKIEYNCAIQTRDSVLSCIQNGQWPKGAAYLFDKDFTAFFKMRQENGHYQAYIEEWKRYCPKD